MKLSENIDFKTPKNDEKPYVKHGQFCRFWKFSKRWFIGFLSAMLWQARGIIPKRAKFGYHIRPKTFTFWTSRVSWKSYLIPMMFLDFSRRFLHSFQSLHSLRCATSSATATPEGTPAFATDYAYLHSLRSLHSLRKVSSKSKKSWVLSSFFMIPSRVQKVKSRVSWVVPNIAIISLDDSL